MPNPSAPLSLEASFKLTENLKQQIERSIFGQEDLITEAICCLISGGHILMTGAPGLAKTTLVRVFSRFLSLKYGRVQFTPDLLPSDIIGSDILNVDPQSGHRSFEFAPGPVFVNLLLADEINRASPRTQSALLEAMQERSCTVGGTSHPLPAPFMVFATQNPFESEGAFPLPEAQLDRFLIHTLVDYPDAESEEKMLQEHVDNRLVGERELAASDASMSADEIHGLLARREMISVETDIIQMIRDLVRSTRPSDEMCPEGIKSSIWYGAGPRAGISLVSVARSLAIIEQSEVVRWRHVRRMAKPVLRHRIRLSARANQDQITEDSIIDELMSRLEERYKMSGQGMQA